MDESARIRISFQTDGSSTTMTEANGNTYLNIEVDLKKDHMEEEDDV